VVYVRGVCVLQVAHGVSGGVPKTTSVYWNNPTETYVDVAKLSAGASARWMSESGAWDLFLIPGPTPAQVFSR
jgi:alpha 1,3-glucosidase